MAVTFGKGHADSPDCTADSKPTAKWPRIALVVPGLFYGGGVPSVARFLHDCIVADGRYQVGLISLALSSSDAVSVRLRAPASLVRGPQISAGEWDGLPYKHVGGVLVDLETQRYRPRPVLSHLLRSYDLVQVVAGTPAWALTVVGCGRPVCLQVATLARVERQSVMRTGGWARRLWRHRMARAVTQLDRRAVPQVDTVFVENRWMHSELGRLVEPSRIIFAPPGVDTDFFHPTTYCPDGYLLSVGRFDDPRKNVRLLFNAYAALSRSGSAVPELVLAGLTGPAPVDWAYALELGIAGRIRVMTGVSQEALVALYQNASLFVLSSDEEGLGIVLLEAMACGLPVVATRCGGPESLVVDGQTGLLKPVGDADAFRHAIAELLTDPARREGMGALGRKRVEELFSMPAAGRRFLDAYDRLLGARSESVVPTA